MKRPKCEYLVLLLVITLLFVGCGSGSRVDEEILPSPPTTPEDSTEDPSGHSDIFITIEEFTSHPHVSVAMSAEVGEELVVTLGSNPTAGYQWQENATISDKDIVAQVSHEFVASGSDVPGSPGYDVWTFRALKKGTANISMECSRPWEEKDVDERTITITVTVK